LGFIYWHKVNHAGAKYSLILGNANREELVLLAAQQNVQHGRRNPLF